LTSSNLAAAASSGPEEVVLIVEAAVLGLVFGSFATAAAYRIPRRESLSKGRSKCPHCGTTIRAVENIPVFSYLFLRGRCRHCGQRISPRYPLIELATGALFAMAAWKFGLSVEGIVYAAGQGQPPILKGVSFSVSPGEALSDRMFVGQGVMSPR
jgi:prepilin signal peptidase PulO-like enzyme (type II secretory pathway)